MPISNFIKKLENAIKDIDNNIILLKKGTEEELIDLIKEADIVISGGKIGHNLSEKVINSAKKIKLLQTCSSGVDFLPFNALIKNNVCVASIKGTNSIPVAEHVFSQMLALSKNTIYQHNLLTNGTWHRLVSQEIFNKTIGIIGLGSIGIEIAKRAKALGMKVYGLKRNPLKTSNDYIDIIAGPKDLINILSKSDFVVICVAYTNETVGLIGENELRSMKKSAYIINVSRGKVIDEMALYKALKEKWIAGAGLDVWYNYPTKSQHSKVYAAFPPSESGIHLLDNVVISPHVGGLSDESTERAIKLMAENIKTISINQEISNIVNLQLKY